jgi:biotin carboxyl carrier protein
MKMQNEIQSPVNGQVTRVSAKANSNVMKDDVLVEIRIV